MTRTSLLSVLRAYRKLKRYLSDIVLLSPIPCSVLTSPSYLYSKNPSIYSTYIKAYLSTKQFPRDNPY